MKKGAMRLTSVSVSFRGLLILLSINTKLSYIDEEELLRLYFAMSSTSAQFSMSIIFRVNYTTIKFESHSSTLHTFSFYP